MRRGEFDEATRLVVRKGPLGNNQVRALAATVKGASQAAKLEGQRNKAGETRRARDGAIASRARAVARLETDLASGAAQDGAIAAARSAGHIGKDEAQRYKSMLDARDAEAERDTVTLERIDSALSGTNILDPASREDRAAADLHYQRTLASDEDGAAPDLLLATARRTRIAPESAVKRLAGTMLAGGTGEKAGAAATLTALIETDPGAAKVLNSGDRQLLKAYTALAQRGIAPETAERLTENLTADTVKAAVAGDNVPAPDADALDPENRDDLDREEARDAAEERRDRQAAADNPLPEQGDLDPEERDELDEDEDRDAAEDRKLDRFGRLHAEFKARTGGSPTTGDFRRAGDAIVAGLDRHKKESGPPDPLLDEIMGLAAEFIPGIGEALSVRETLEAIDVAGKAFADGRLDDVLEGGGVAVIAALGAIPVFGKLKKLPEIAGRIARLAARLGERKVATIADVEGEIAPALKRTRAQIKELRHLEKQKIATRESLFAAKPGTTERAQRLRDLRATQLKINQKNGAGYERQSERFLKKHGLPVNNKKLSVDTPEGRTTFDLTVGDPKNPQGTVEIKSGNARYKDPQKSRQKQATDTLNVPNILFKEGKPIVIVQPKGKK